MMKRWIAAFGMAALLAGASGCKTQLDQAWTYGEYKDHAEKIDSDLAEFYDDVRDNIFGIPPQQQPPVWFTYRD